MHVRVILIFAILFGAMEGASADAASDLRGKLNLFVAGREQGIFEKAAVKFEKLNPMVRTRFAATDGAEPLAALADGSVDIVVLGQTLKPEEKE